MTSLLKRQISVLGDVRKKSMLLYGKMKQT